MKIPIVIEFINYLPIASTVVAIAFSRVLYRHWRRNPQAKHVMWWMIGVMLFGAGTFTEALTTLFGWHEPIFRSWYIAGALLGGAPLAQGTVYLLLKPRTADRLARWLMGYISVAAVFAIVTPLKLELVDDRLSAEVIEWTWVRLFSPLINTYALIYLVGGAVYSAIKYRGKSGAMARRKWGNIFIAVGGLLPGIGGAFTRAGYVEVLFVTELIGLSLIWAGYHLIANDAGPSIHPIQRQLAARVD